MLGDEVEKVAEQIDVTPAHARRIMLIQEFYPKMKQEVVELDPNKGLDRRILDAFGWKDNGQGGMGYIGKIIVPPKPTSSGGFKIL